MTFPATALTIVVEIEINSVWTDISQYVRLTHDIVIARGKSSPLATTVPASASVVVDNEDGRFSVNNPVGAWYGLLRRGTRVRVRVNPGSGLVTRFTGEVPEWAPRRSVSGRNNWAEIKAYGVTYRLAAGGRARSGALTRYISSLTTGLIGYWPLEDGSDATSAASAVPGVPPMIVVGSARFGQTAPLSGVSSLMFPAGAFLVGRPRGGSGSTSHRVECVVSFSAVPLGGRRILSWLTTGDATTWNLESLPGGFRVRGWFDDAGTSTLVQEIVTATLPVPGRLHHLRVDTQVVGADMLTTFYVDGVSLGSDTLLAASCSAPYYLRDNPDANDDEANTPSTGHIAIWAPIPATSSSDQAALAWLGQEAHQRIEGVCSTAGISYSPVLGATVDSEPLGPQPLDSIMRVLRDAEATDGGLLFELTTGDLTYVRRAALLNQSVAMAVDYAQRQVSPPFEPTTDDTNLRNDVTATRPGGSEGHYADDAHIAAEGLHEDSISVNPESDSRLSNLAAWAVHLGTIAGDRWDSLSLNLAHPRGSSLIASWLALDVGERVTVDNVPAALTPDLVDVIMVGYTETIRKPRTWRVDMVCEPAAPYTVAVRGTARRDTAGSQLNAGVTATATSWSVATTLGPLWATGATSFALQCGGEQVTVTNITGATSPQTFTVTRSVNGVVKAQSSGTPVSLWTPATRAL